MMFPSVYPSLLQYMAFLCLLIKKHTLNNYRDFLVLVILVALKHSKYKQA